MWDSLLDGFGSLLSFFYAGIPNYGVAIILLTVAIRLVLYPLTAKQAKSMAAMQRIQPEVKKLQNKYKDDRQKLNEELMALYKEHQVNPLSGCLPLVAQFPIFIALFQVLRSPSSHIPDGSSLFDAFCPGLTPAECAEQGAQGLTFLGMDLSRGANAAHESFLAAVPFFILIGLVVASGYLQTRQMSRLQKGGSTTQTQLIGKVMPAFFGLISYTLPAGVVVYFLVSNVWQIGQQQVVFKRIHEPEAAKANKANKTKQQVSGTTTERDGADDTKKSRSAGRARDGDGGDGGDGGEGDGQQGAARAAADAGESGDGSADPDTVSSGAAGGSGRADGQRSRNRSKNRKRRKRRKRK